MKAANPFDTMITVQKNMPSAMRDGAIELTDTLDLCWAAARAVFDTKAVPEHALALLPMFMARADAKRLEQLTEFQKSVAAASGPAAKSKRPRRSPMAS